MCPRTCGLCDVETWVLPKVAYNSRVLPKFSLDLFEAAEMNETALFSGIGVAFFLILTIIGAVWRLKAKKLLKAEFGVDRSGSGDIGETDSPQAAPIRFFGGMVQTVTAQAKG